MHAEFLDKVIPQYDPINQPNISNCTNPASPSRGGNNDAMIYIIVGVVTACIVVMILFG